MQETKSSRQDAKTPSCEGAAFLEAGLYYDAEEANVRLQALEEAVAEMCGRCPLRARLTCWRGCAFRRFMDTTGLVLVPNPAGNGARRAGHAA